MVSATGITILAMSYSHFYTGMGVVTFSFPTSTVDIRFN